MPRKTTETVQGRLEALADRVGVDAPPASSEPAQPAATSSPPAPQAGDPSTTAAEPVEAFLDFEALRLSQPCDQIAGALVRAQAKINPVPRTSEGQVAQRVYSYADLAEIRKAIQKPFEEEGLAIVQGAKLTGLETVKVLRRSGREEIPAEISGGRVAVTTLLLHVSGQWAVTTLEAFSRDPFPQAVGSAMTYGRRYGLSGLAGIVPDTDDDGAGAQPRGGESAAAPRQQPSSPPRSDRPRRPAHGLELKAGVPVLPFGNNKGQTLREVSDQDLLWYAEAAKSNLDNPEKARWHDQDRARLEVYREEARRRKREAGAGNGSAGPPPDDDGPPPEAYEQGAGP